MEVNGELAIDERQFRARQDRLVFAYLVFRRAAPVPREELANVVWPGEAPAAWEASLSALLSRLRALLASNGLTALGTTISRGFGQYQLHLPGDAWVDLGAAASAVDEAEGALRAGDPRRAFGPATVASTIARRPFLAGDEGEWIDSQRRKLRRQLLRALDCLAEIWLSTGEPVLAVEAAAEAVGIDPVRESSHRLLMRAHTAAGNTAESVKSYHRLRELLAEELGTDPSAETEALYMELLS
ncbi:MAG TPA: bacterial transcriptional activator domain-containing protein [Dehalococcoidia bacterium]|nr:bacterial transcriptional activator domain-containing protein [Dehalococcoidia bacterium]